MAAVLAMSGYKAEAEKILSKDLPPEQVQQAMDAFSSAAAARSNAAAGLLATTPAAPPQSVAPAAAPPVAPPGPCRIRGGAAASTAAQPPQPRPPAPPLPHANGAQPPAEAHPCRPPSANAAGGKVEVQLAGPTPSRDAAEVKWGRLQRQMPDAFAGHQPILAEIHGSWRDSLAGPNRRFCRRRRGQCVLRACPGEWCELHAVAVTLGRCGPPSG